MIVLWTLLLICIQQSASLKQSSHLDINSGDASDFLLNFMQKTYKVGQAKGSASSVDPGAPLLLTPYIEKNKLNEARKAASVDPAYLLPGMTSYAGYLTVNKEYNANLWFWYFPVSGKPVEDTPWILWLQGGPGASSLYGLFNEIGPFFVGKNNSLKEIQHSWGQNHSLLFIDNPVGTGFSFTDDERGYATNQSTIGENLYAALQQFLTIFPELRKAPLTVAGESYAGKHIPSLGVQIHWHRHENHPINLQGLAIGNGFIDPVSLQRYSYFVREVGLVDDSVADAIKGMEDEVTNLMAHGELYEAYTIYNFILHVIECYGHLTNVYNYLRDDIDIEGPYLGYIQRADVRRALHVGNTNFTSIGVVYRKLVPDMMGSAKTWLEELLDNYRVMLYNGHLDIIVAYHPSVNTYRSLNFSGTLDFKDADREPWYHDKQLAGYYRLAANLTEVMVRGAGHMVPSEKPGPALGLISAFARGVSLEEDTGRFVKKDNMPRVRQLPLE